MVLQGPIGALQPAVDLIRPLILEFSVVVGGIFGLYIILIIVRIHYERKKIRIMEDLRFVLDQQNLSKGLLTSKQKKTLFKRIWIWIKSFFAKKEVPHKIVKHKK